MCPIIGPGGKRSLSIIVVALLCASCALWRDRNAERNAPDEPEITAQSPAKDTGEDRESQLKGLVRARIEMAARNQENRKARLISRPPYHFKEYDEYPQGPDTYHIEMRETESRTAPASANVTIPKVRFATRLHRDRDEAQADTNFFRDTGAETVTYEFRYGKWLRAGSLFVAEKTEENVNGAWQPVEPKVERTVPQEEEQAESWWKRTWNTITGR
ncbi:MAG: hypothetical protein HY706_18160 [Candidatus Hydrogenedentes bacterium]|nr:hypothetical protein [Candidatus Hydrogenedentota bacterium]